MTKKLSQTQYAIINAAQIIFARYGYRKTTVDEIAQEAHIAKSSIYRYFKNKEEIFETVAEKEEKTGVKRIKRAINAADNAKDKLRAYVFTKMQILKEMANFYCILKDEYLVHYDFAKKLRKKYVEEEIVVIEKILKIGVKQGVFVIKDLKLTTFAFVTALMGFEIILISENRIVDLNEGIERLFQMLFYGIAKK